MSLSFPVIVSLDCSSQELTFQALQERVLVQIAVSFLVLGVRPFELVTKRVDTVVSSTHSNSGEVPMTYA